jgi:hypothetical protein
MPPVWGCDPCCDGGSAGKCSPLIGRLGRRVAGRPNAGNSAGSWKATISAMRPPSIRRTRWRTLGGRARRPRGTQVGGHRGCPLARRPASGTGRRSPASRGSSSRSAPPSRRAGRRATGSTAAWRSGRPRRGGRQRSRAPSPGPMQGAGHRRFGDAQVLGGLPGRPAEHVPQDEDRPAAGRQVLEAGDERQLDRFAADGHM